MCMIMKRMRIMVKQTASSSRSTNSSSSSLKASARSKLKATRVPDDSMSTTTTSTATTTSSRNLSKESQVSNSTSSVTSLPGIKDMLSNGAIIFKLKDLSIATENFNSEKKVGTFVFRGSVHGMDVAVVVVKNHNSNYYNKEDFVAEMKNLCSVHHTNLVKLIGGCNADGQIYLVYEFIASGNLRQYLHSQYAPGFSALPTWTSRLQVVLDVAKGLEYLHHHTRTGAFVHKHLKSSNILLDSELHARIAFFGVAKIRGEAGEGYTSPPPPATAAAAGGGRIPIAAGEAGSCSTSSTSSGEIQELTRGDHRAADRVASSASSSSAASASSSASSARVLGRSFRQSHSIRISGTHGYMAPEEKTGGLITPKLDVFAFGVILLEIMSGKEAVSFLQTKPGTYKKTLLPDVIRSIFEDKEPGRRLRAWMDPLLGDSAPLDCALKTAELAKDCVDPNPNSRPDMSKVALILSKILINSQAREKSILAAKGVLTSTMEAR